MAEKHCFNCIKIEWNIIVIYSYDGAENANTYEGRTIVM